MFVCQHCNEISANNYKRPSNSRCWTVGETRHGMFHIREIFFDLGKAQLAKRNDEEIRGGLVVIERMHRRRDPSRASPQSTEPSVTQPT